MGLGATLPNHIPACRSEFPSDLTIYENPLVTWGNKPFLFPLGSEVGLKKSKLQTKNSVSFVSDVSVP